MNGVVLLVGGLLLAAVIKLIIVSNTSAKERQHKCEVLISEAMGIASVQNPFTDRNMPYEQPFQPDAGDAEAVPIFVILSPIC